MDDLPTRLRRWTHAVNAVPASDLMDEAAAEIERLRWRVMTLESAAKYADAMLSERDKQTAPPGVETDAAPSGTRFFQLTHEELDAVEWAADHLDASGWSSQRLRGLLERLG